MGRGRHDKCDFCKRTTGFYVNPLPNWTEITFKGDTRIACPDCHADFKEFWDRER